MGDSTGLTTRARLLREAVYNTPPSGDFWDIPFLAGTVLGTTQANVNNPVIGQGRDPAQPLRGPITAGGKLVVPMDVRNFGLHLAALLGDPTTTHPSGHYQHVFNSGVLTPTPQSIEMAHPRVPKYLMNSGQYYDQMDITLAPSGMPSATFTLIGTDEIPADASAAGTPGNLDATGDHVYFSHLKMSLTRNGTGIGNVVSGSLSFKNNLAAANVVANNGKIGGVIPGQTALTGKVSARFNDYTLLGDATTGANLALAFIWTNSADQKLTLALPLVMLAKPPITISGPGGISVDLDFQAFGSPDTPTPMLTATLLNDLDGTAYAA